MQKLLLLLSCLIVHATTIAQTFEWAKSLAGAAGYNQGNSVAVDDLGNVYTTGYFHGTVDFDPNIGTSNLTTEGSWDIFIQKLDAEGNFIWAKGMGGLGNGHVAQATAIAVDGLGNVYITGWFSGTADFDPGLGVNNLTALGGDDVFVQKLDSAGNFLWVKSVGGAAEDRGSSIAVDGSGHVYIVGKTYGVVDFDPGPGVFNLIYDDLFTLKLDTNGNFIWAKGLETNYWVAGNSITIDDSGDVYITGWFSGPVDFDPNAGVSILEPFVNGNQDVFIQKLDTDGSFLWAKNMGAISGERGKSVAVDGSGNVYSTGYFSGTVDFDPNTGVSDLTSLGSYDVFIQKLDAAGNFIWAKRMGGASLDIGASIAIDHLDNVYTTGEFRDTVDFDPNMGITELVAAGTNDIFIQKLDNEGNFLWAKSMGGTSSDLGGALVIDDSGNIYTTGWFSDTVDFDPNAGTYDLTSTGDTDIFIQKLSPCVPNTGTAIISACDSIIWIDGITYTANNNTATHTIVNEGCCDSIVTLDLTIMSLVLDTFKNESCVGLNDGFINTSLLGGAPPFNFAWNTTDTTNNITDLSAGIYTLTVTDATSCVITWQDTLQAAFTPTVAPFVGQAPTIDITVDWNDIILIDAGNDQSADGVIYSWVETSGLGHLNLADSMAPATTINPQPTSEGTYVLLLTATSENGCMATGSLRITIDLANPVAIPNVFSPNGDGVNDFFGPLGLDDQSILEFRIYSRWGQLVFDGKDANSNWDGTFRSVPLPSDVYVYTLRYWIPSQGEKMVKGGFTLVR